MKNRVPALILAIGISAAPVFAKQSNRRVDNKDSSKIEERKLAEKRVENSYKRVMQLEMEKEYIKETEAEILNVLSTPIEKLYKVPVKMKIKDTLPKIIVTEPVPVNGVDITDAYLKIKHISESS
jgi:hypothetical protein